MSRHPAGHLPCIPAEEFGTDGRGCRAGGVGHEGEDSLLAGWVTMVGCHRCGRLLRCPPCPPCHSSQRGLEDLPVHLPYGIFRKGVNVVVGDGCMHPRELAQHRSGQVLLRECTSRFVAGSHDEGARHLAQVGSQVMAVAAKRLAVSSAPSPGSSTQGQAPATRVASSAQARSSDRGTAMEFATLEWVSWFNHHRLLEPIGYIPPAEAEANYYRQLASQATSVVD